MAAPAPSSAGATYGLFSAAAEGFERAVQRCPDDLCEVDLWLVGNPVRLRIVGSGLARAMARPFQHLRLSEPPGEPRLTIDLWDASATDVPNPVAAGGSDARLWWMADGVISASADGRFVGYEQDVAGSWLDRATGRIVGWRRSEAPLAGERSKPLAMLLALWYGDRGIQVVHAGLVSRGAEGVLIGGPSGAGKSTTSLACLEAGYAFLADDQSALEAGERGDFAGHSLYCSARLVPAQIGRFRLPEHAVDRQAQPDGKAVLLFSDAVGERLQRQTSIRLLVLPRFSPRARAAEARPAKRSEALLRVALSSVFMPLGPGARALTRLGELVETVPSYWLDFGPDPSGIPGAIDRLLDQTA